MNTKLKNDLVVLVELLKEIQRLEKIIENSELTLDFFKSQQNTNFYDTSTKDTINEISKQIGIENDQVRKLRKRFIEIVDAVNMTENIKENNSNNEGFLNKVKNFACDIIGDINSVECKNCDELFMQINEFENIYNKDINEYQNQINTLYQENNELKEYCDEYKKKCNSKKQIGHLQKKYDKLSNNHELLLSDYQEIRTRYDELVNAEQDREQLKYDFSNLCKLNNDINENLHIMKGEYDNLKEKCSNEINTLKNKILNLCDANNMLTNDKDKLIEVCDEYKKKCCELSKIEQDLNEYISLTFESNNKMIDNDEIKNLTESIYDKENMIKDLKSMNIQLNEKLIEELTNNKNKIAKLKNIISEQQNIVSEKNNEINDLKSTTKQSENTNDSKISHLNGEIIKCEDIIRKHCETYLEQCEGIASLKKKLAEQEKSIKNKDIIITNLDKTLIEYKNDNEYIRTEHLKSEQKIKEINKNSNIEISNLIAQIKQKDTNFKNSQESVSKITRDLIATAYKISELENTIKNVSEINHSLQQKFNATSEELEIIKNERNMLALENEKMRSKNKTLVDLTNNLNVKINSSHNKVHQKKPECVKDKTIKFNDVMTDIDRLDEDALIIYDFEGIVGHINNNNDLMIIPENIVMIEHTCFKFPSYILMNNQNFNKIQLVDALINNGIEHIYDAIIVSLDDTVECIEELMDKHCVKHVYYISNNEQITDNKNITKFNINM